MTNYNFSIIIPHKNTPDLLQRCLDSIPRREDIQIIVVDDNSDPSVVDFNRVPGVGEENIELYSTKEGRGAGYARNIGLEHAKGKWILFIDADDYYTDSLITSIDKYNNSEADIVFFNTNSIYEESSKQADRHLHINYCTSKFLDEGNDSFLRYYRYSPVAKMIKLSIIKDHSIRFDETIAANDARFSVISGFYANKIEADNSIIYIITSRAGSLEYTYSLEILDARINIDHLLNNFFHTHQINIRINPLRYMVFIIKIGITPFLSRYLKYFILRPYQCIIDTFSIIKEIYPLFLRKIYQKNNHKKIKIIK